MRPDMKKVVIERPRLYGESRGSYSKTGREPQRTKNDLEHASTKAPMRDKRRRTKSFNEHLAPLQRYLVKQVGRPFDKVWSEIVSGLGGGKGTLQDHVLGHARDYVEVDVEMVDGIPHARHSGRLEPVVSRFTRHDHNRLYVHPVSGLLLLAKAPKKREERFDVHRIDGTSAAIVWRDQWYLATLRDLPMVALIGPAATTVKARRDAWLERNATEYDAERLWGRYKGRTQYATSVRTLSKAEVRRLALPRDVTGV